MYPFVDRAVEWQCRPLNSHPAEGEWLLQRRETTDTDRIVVWFFERSGAFVRFESRAVEERGDLFELVVVQPDGTEKIEHFKDSDALMQRQLQLERTMAHDGWQGPFGRIF